VKEVDEYGKNRFFLSWRWIIDIINQSQTSKTSLVFFVLPVYSSIDGYLLSTPVSMFDLGYNFCTMLVWREIEKWEISSSLNICYKDPQDILLNRLTKRHLSLQCEVVIFSTFIFFLQILNGFVCLLFSWVTCMLRLNYLESNDILVVDPYLFTGMSTWEAEWCMLPTITSCGKYDPYSIRIHKQIIFEFLSGH